MLTFAEPLYCCSI